MPRRSFAAWRGAGVGAAGWIFFFGAEPRRGCAEGASAPGQRRPPVAGARERTRRLVRSGASTRRGRAGATPLIKRGAGGGADIGRARERGRGARSELGAG